MSRPIVIQFGENQGCNKKITFNFTFLLLLSLTVNVPFCREDGGGELCKLNFQEGFWKKNIISDSER